MSKSCAIELPFDQPGSRAKYEIDFFPESAEQGDGVILAANREGLLALADTLRQIAEKHPGYHIHLGYDEQVPQGPGLRIVFSETGRIGGT